MNMGRIILKNDPVLGSLTCKPCLPAADGFIIRPELQMNMGRIILKNDPVLGGLTCKPCLPLADGFIIRPELQMNLRSGLMIKPPSLRDEGFFVAGAGFEPTTFGL